MIKSALNPNWKDPNKLRLAKYRELRQRTYAEAKRHSPLIVANFEKAVEERRKRL